MSYVKQSSFINSDVEFFRKKFKKNSLEVLINPNALRHVEPSLIYSIDSDVLPNDYLIELSLAASSKASKTHIENIDKTKQDSVFFNTFPGEHYRLLKSLTSILNPKIVVEIGTSTGMGSTAILQGLNNGKLITFDLLSWNQFSSHLKKELFGDHFEQILIDLSIEPNFESYKDLLNEADYIFIDGPKNSIFEYEFSNLLTRLDKKARKLLIFDDIRFVNMIDLWTSIKSPKIDLTSFGHWSGTGIVDISNGFYLNKTSSYE